MACLPLPKLAAQTAEIVGVDLRSQTSPTMVLDRYRQRGLMGISEWSDGDDDFMPMDDLLARDKKQHDVTTN